MPTLSELTRKTTSPLTKKQRRILARFERFTNLALEDRAYCEAHEKYLCARDIQAHHCHSGNKGKRYCPYFKIMPKVTYQD